MPTLQLRRTSLLWFQRGMEFCSSFLWRGFFFQLLRWVIILFSSLTSVRFSFLSFSFFFFFSFVLFCFSFKMFHFPTIYLGSGWFFFFFFQKIPSPLDIKWCTLILILLHRWWWTLRHRQFWIPVQFSEKSNPYSITQMMVDITSSTILNSRAIQWKIQFQSEISLIQSWRM